MEFLIGIVVGGLLLGGCYTPSRFEDSMYGRLNGWLNKKRYERLKVKAKRLGFEAEFQEEWRHYEDRPFALQNAESYRAFYRAKAHYQQRTAAKAA